MHKPAVSFGQRQREYDGHSGDGDSQTLGGWRSMAESADGYCAEQPQGKPEPAQVEQVGHQEDQPKDEQCRPCREQHRRPWLIPHADLDMREGQRGDPELFGHDSPGRQSGSAYLVLQPGTKNGNPLEGGEKLFLVAVEVESEREKRDRRGKEHGGQPGEALEYGFALPECGDDEPCKQHREKHPRRCVEILCQAKHNAGHDEGESTSDGALISEVPGVPQKSREADDEQPIPNVVQSDAAEVDMKMRCSQVAGCNQGNPSPQCFAGKVVECEDGQGTRKSGGDPQRLRGLPEDSYGKRLHEEVKGGERIPANAEQVIAHTADEFNRTQSSGRLIAGEKPRDLSNKQTSQEKGRYEHETSDQEIRS